MALFNILVDIAARTANLESGMKRAESSITGFQQSVAKSAKSLASLTAITAAGGAFFGFIKNAGQAALAVDDVADRMDASVSSVSALQAVFKEFDGDVQALQPGFRNLNRLISEAGTGNKAAMQTFSDLRVDFQALRQLKPEDQLAVMADAFSGIPDKANRTRLAMEAFGKSGDAWLPVLRAGGDEIRNFAAGVSTLDNRAVASLDRASKAIDKFWTSVNNKTANRFGNFLANFFPSGDKLLELEFELEQARKRRNSADAEKGMTEALNKERRRAYDIEIAKIEEQIALLKLRNAELQFTPFDMPSIPMPEIEIDGEREMAEFEERQKRMQAANAANFAERRSMEESISDFQRELAEGNNELIKELTEDQFEVRKEYVNKFSEFELEAQRRTQNIISQTIRTGFEGGFRGAFDAFRKMIEDMVIEAASAKIAEAIFGDGTNGDTGFNIGQYFSSVFSGSRAGGSSGGGADYGDSGMGEGTAPGGFSGPRDMGGPVQAGKSYFIGRGAQPELFTPSSDGYMTPANQLGSKTIFVNNWTINGDPNSEQVRMTQQMIQRSQRQMWQQQSRNRRVGLGR